jgi:hypothetical protein
MRCEDVRYAISSLDWGRRENDEAGMRQWHIVQLLRIREPRTKGAHLPDCPRKNRWFVSDAKCPKAQPLNRLIKDHPIWPICAIPTYVGNR